MPVTERNDKAYVEYVGVRAAGAVIAKWKSIYIDNNLKIAGGMFVIYLQFILFVGGIYLDICSEDNRYRHKMLFSESIYVEDYISNMR